MLRPDSELKKLLSDVIKIATSKEGLRQKLSVPLYRNAIYLILDSALVSVLGLVFWILAARFYPVQDIGLASASISAMRLLALLATVGLDYGIIRFLSKSGKDSNALINSALTISVLASIFISLIFIAGLSLWSPALLSLRQDLIFLVTFVAATALFTILTILGRIFVAERRAGFTLGQGAIQQLVKILLVVLFAVFSGAFCIFASWGIAQAVAVLIGLFLFLPRLEIGFRPWLTIKSHVMKKMVSFSFANYIAMLLWVAPSLILPLIVTNLLGAESNAYFFIAWAMGSLAFAISESTFSSLFAEGAYDEQKLDHDSARSLKLSFVLLIPAIALFFIFGSKLLLLFNPAYAENGTKLLWILALSAVPLTLNRIYCGMKTVEMNMKIVILLNGLAAVVTLTLSWALLPIMGIIGAGVAWLSGQSAVALIVIPLWLRSRKARQP